MEITASKLDWLKSRKDFNTNPTARATARLLEHEYPHGDDLFPWISREVKKGNLKLPPEYDRGWIKLVEMEMMAEQELARRQALADAGEPTPPEWAGEGQTDWSNLQAAPWNNLHDFVRSMQEPPPFQSQSLWEKLHEYKRFMSPSPMSDVPDHEVNPEELRRWEQVLQDRAKRQKGVDPMQYTYGELANEMQNRWLPEWEAKQRQGLGQVVHKFPNGWTMRKVGPEEAAREGAEMGHCVGTETYGYPEKMRAGDTHIFSLRDKANFPHTTLEIQSPPNQTNSYRIVRGVPEEWYDMFGVPRGNWSAVRDYIGDFMHGYRRPEELDDKEKWGESPMWPTALLARHIWQNYQETQREEPWHGGSLEQVQGKENNTPIPPYQDMIRNWFDSMPQEHWPSNLEESAYHPNNTEAPESVYTEPPVAPPVQHYEARTEEHYPSPAHKNHQTGKICHCPWGPARSLWSWTSGHFDEDDADAGWMDDPQDDSYDWREDIPDASGEIQPWKRGSYGKGLLTSNGLKIWSTDVYGDPHHDEVAAREQIPYLAKVDIMPNGGAALTSPDETSLNGIDRETANQLLSKFGPQQGLSLIPGFLSKARERTNARDLHTEGTDSDPLVDLIHGGPPEQRGLTIAKDIDTTVGDGLWSWDTLEEMSHDRHIIAEKVIPHENLHQPCPTCHNEMVNGHCSQCEWSNLEPNIDSDPLSNPPDPTVDMHRGVQSGLYYPSDHWGKWYEAAYEANSVSWE